MLVDVLGRKSRYVLHRFRGLSPCRIHRKFSISPKQKYVRVRFAPSPTGFLHIGGLRTALLNYLFAKSKGGQFIIRIEDTDQARVVPGAVNSLLDQLKWVGIIADEGPIVGGEYGPYTQSERLDIYKKYAEKLLENGSAYRCFCSQRRLDILRRDQVQRKEQSRYDNRCRGLTQTQVEEKLNAGEPHVLRLRLSDEIKTFDDVLYGKIKHDITAVEGDPVIYKSDGYPTYHLANVVDDHLMKISHVLRGKEWILSTIKHVMLYEAFGWKPPVYVHLPLFLNEDGKKLSKRQGDVFVEQYREKGYHPTALLNFMVHHGGGFSEKVGTIFGDKLATPTSALEQMTPEFSLDKVGNNDSVVQFWKMDEYNSLILKHLLESADGERSLLVELRNLVMEKFGTESTLNEIGSEEKKMEFLRRLLKMRQLDSHQYFEMPD